jgi:uncharacterized BrkB/YihY/UPF0761 family membrane protein
VNTERGADRGSTGGRAGNVAKAAQRRARDARTRLEEARPRSRTVDTTFSLIDRDREGGGPLLAGAVAFRLFLWLLPLALVLVAGIGFLAAADQEAPRTLAEDAGIVGFAADSIAEATDQRLETRVFALVVGLPALYLASSAAAKALRATHALAWGVRITKVATPRAVLAVLATTLAALTVLIATTKLRDADERLGLGITLTALVAFGGIWLVASWWLPHAPDIRWTALVPGALLVGAGVQIMHVVTVYYLSRKVASASDTYGALGAATALLLGLYLFGRLFVLSAMLNAELWERKRGRSDAESGQQARHRAGSRSSESS